MRIPSRAAGVLLVAAGLLLGVGLPMRALSADDADFDRVVGWANIFALSIAVIGVGLWFAERGVSRAPVAQAEIDAYLDELATMVLEQESRQRMGLLGSDSPSTVAANVQYDRLIQFHQTGSDREGDLAGVGDFYIDHTSGRLVILGAPGAGKTVLALELLIQLLERRNDCADERRRAAIAVPVRLNLPGWNTDQPFEHWLSVELQQRYGMAGRLASALVQQRRILPILDGLDEMDNAGADPTRARAAVAQLNQYALGRSGAPLVVACRDGEYARLDDALRPAVQIGIRPLTPAQISDYIQRQADVRGGLQDWQKLLDAIGTDPGVLAQIDSPWRMMLAVTFHRDGGNLGQLLPMDGEPTSPETPYAQRVTDLLLGRFIPARTRLCEPGRYQPDDVTRWLRHVAAHLGWQSDNGRSSTDIVLHEWWPSAGPHRVRRWHGVVAVGLVLIALLVAGLSVNEWDPAYALRRLAANLTDLRDASLQDLAGGTAFLMLFLAFPSVSFYYGHRMECEPAVFSLQQVRTYQGKRQLRNGMAVGLLIGVAGGTVSVLGQWLTVRLVIASPVTPAGMIALGLGVGLVLGVLVGLVLGLKPLGAVVVNPRDPLRNDFIEWLVIGVVAALVASAITGFTYGDIFGGLPIGIPTGLMLGLVTGTAGHATLRYAVARVCLARTGTGPLAFTGFVTWAHRAGILRISGNAYQLRHNELRDWLREVPQAPAETTVVR